jgi:hypothetical protein
MPGRLHGRGGLFLGEQFDSDAAGRGDSLEHEERAGEAPPLHRRAGNYDRIEARKDGRDNTRTLFQERKKGCGNQNRLQALRVHCSREAAIRAWQSNSAVENWRELASHPQS